MNDVVICIPNHLPSLEFLQEWQELRDAQIIVMQDIGAKPLAPRGFRDVAVYDHRDVERDLGKSAWIIPTYSSACRSYVYYKAWQRNPRYILTLDNDCFPEGNNWIASHIERLEEWVTLDWVNSSSQHEILFRGHPYGVRGMSQVMLSHGLWSNVPDLDAPTSLHNPKLRLDPTTERTVVPRNNFFPMCGMNLAWKRDLTPALYFGLFGPQYGFDQYDDIWAGVLVKKVLDHLGYAAVSGFPSVEHRKQSNVYTNLRKQAPGFLLNEHFWQEVQAIQLTSTSIIKSYEELVRALPSRIPGDEDLCGWIAKFKAAALIWAQLFHVE